MTPLARTAADARRWARLRARCGVAPGSASERALATAVLLDAALHPPAVRRMAAEILRGARPAVPTARARRTLPFAAPVRRLA